jgi:ligand-binding sensor domain-containing protein
MTVTPLTQLAGAGQALTHPYVRLMYKDSRGVFWFGATRGLNRFDPVSGEIRNYMPAAGDALSLPHFRVRALYEDIRGQIWAGTSDGLMLLDGAGNPIRVIHADEDVSGGLIMFLERRFENA